MTSPVTATVILPENFTKFSGRTLSLADLVAISCYTENIINVHKNVNFNADGFTGITFYNYHLNKYSVFALPDDLLTGPEYRLNKPDEYCKKETDKLRTIVVDYLSTHPELGLTINDFS